MGKRVLAVALMPLQVEVLFVRIVLMRSGHEKVDPPAVEPEIEAAFLDIAVLSSWTQGADRTAWQVPSSFSTAADEGGAMWEGIRIQPVYGRFGSERFCTGLSLESSSQYRGVGWGGETWNTYEVCRPRVCTRDFSPPSDTY
jgi:hypothetical protein